MLKEYMPPEARPDDPIWTTNIMTYELGAVVRGLIYAHHRGNQGDTKTAKANLADARINLADLITQCRLLAEQMKWKWFDLEVDGSERFVKRMSEIKEGVL